MAVASTPSYSLIMSLCILQKERRLLENLRLDLDACKARLKKAKMAEAKAAVSPIMPLNPQPHSHTHSMKLSNVIKHLAGALAMTNCLYIHNLCSARVKWVLKPFLMTSSMLHTMSCFSWLTCFEENILFAIWLPAARIFESLILETKTIDRKNNSDPKLSLCRESCYILNSMMTN